MKRLVLAILAMLLCLGACSPTEQTLKDNIIGMWVNTEGFIIEFYPDGEGFIPGIEGEVPSSEFQYSIVDETHVLIELFGVEYSVEIRISGDTLIWIDRLGEVEYIRAK